MWHTSSCRWSQIHTILKVRSHTLYTASSHTTRPYKTALGPSFADTCPICPFYSSSPPPRDTPGHWLGSCSHPILKAAYIARHNKALCLIQKAISTTSPAAWYTVLDASAADSLPPGVSCNRLPSWLLPSLPPSTLACLRPDLLIIKGLSLSSSRDLSALLTQHDPATIASLKASCRLYIAELSFTCDEFYNRALAKKKSQHYFLIASLLSEGWIINTAPVPPSLPDHLQWIPPPSIPLLAPDQPPIRTPASTLSTSPTYLARYVHILLFTHSCIIPQNIQVLLDALSVPRFDSHTLLNALAMHTVRSTDSIVRTRRFLERDPSTFSRPPLFRTLHSAHQHPTAHHHDPP